jgi:hypothetical protein
MRVARRSAAPRWAVRDCTNAYCLTAGKTRKTKVRHAPSRRTTTDVPRPCVGSPSLKRAESSTTAISVPRKRIFSIVIVTRRVAGALAHAASSARRIASCPDLVGPSTIIKSPSGTNWAAKAAKSRLLHAASAPAISARIPASSVAVFCPADAFGACSGVRHDDTAMKNVMSSNTGSTRLS